MPQIIHELLFIALDFVKNSLTAKQNHCHNIMLKFKICINQSLLSYCYNCYLTRILDHHSIIKKKIVNCIMYIPMYVVGTYLHLMSQVLIIIGYFNNLQKQ